MDIGPEQLRERVKSLRKRGESATRDKMRQTRSQAALGSQRPAAQSITAIVLSREELMALRLLVQRLGVTIMPDILLNLQEKGFIAQRDGSLIVTSLGYAALAGNDSEPPPTAA